MRYFTFPTQDAAIYSEFSNRNTGLDEILEVGKTANGSGSVRSLVSFDLSSVSGLPATTNFDLVLYVANASNLKANQGVEICQLSQSWAEGTGYFYQEIVSTDDGATWSQNISGSSWSSGSQGGSYLSVISSSLSNPIGDLTVNVTSIVQQWISGSSNYGFLVKFPTVDEGDILNQGNVKFFSKDTHTIYKPTLVARWMDQSYITGSSPYPTSSLMVVPDIKPAYRVNETVRIDLAVRERYPLKTFSSVATFGGTQYLPSSSYYSIVDEQSGTTIIPFSPESSVSTAGDQSYFTFKVQNMYSRRYYRVLIQVDHDGLSEIFDSNNIFTVK